MEPEESSRSDYLAAQGLALQYNLHRGKDDAAISPADFLPWVDKPVVEEKKLTDDEAAKAQAAFFGKLSGE